MKKQTSIRGTNPQRKPSGSYHQLGINIQKNTNMTQIM